MTLNEPQVFIGLGHAARRSTQAIRAHATLTPTISKVPAAKVDYPASDAPKDIEAAHRSNFSTGDSAFNTSWYTLVSRRHRQPCRQLFADHTRPSETDPDTTNFRVDLLRSEDLSLLRYCTRAMYFQGIRSIRPERDAWQNCAASYWSLSAASR